MFINGSRILLKCTKWIIIKIKSMFWIQYFYTERIYNWWNFQLFAIRASMLVNLVLNLTCIRSKRKLQSSKFQQGMTKASFKEQRQRKVENKYRLSMPIHLMNSLYFHQIFVGYKFIWLILWVAFPFSKRAQLPISLAVRNFDKPAPSTVNVAILSCQWAMLVQNTYMYIV